VNSRRRILEFLRGRTPEGWTAHPVPPLSQPEANMRCQSCGLAIEEAKLFAPDRSFGPAVLTQPDAAKKVLWYCLAFVCDACHDDKARMDKLTLAAFGPQDRPKKEPGRLIVT